MQTLVECRGQADGAEVAWVGDGNNMCHSFIHAARMLGFERADGARFAVLLGIPAIAASAVPSGIALYARGDAVLGFDALLAALLAFAAAVAALAVMMSWLRRATFTPFVAYRIVLGAVLLWLIYQPSWLTS